jgi:pimeloyl-ACP methyl ester carboxylesterase
VTTTLERWGSRGPILLAIHGMTSSRLSWQRLAQRLDGRFRVVAYDQRGHGDSAEVTGPMSLERGVRDAENVFAALGEPVDVLLGHSWGGAVAILAGLDLPAARVAAVDPMIAQASGAWYEAYIEELRDSFLLEGAERDARTREEFAEWSPLDIGAKVHAVHSMTTAPIEGLWKENPPETWDLRDVIAHYGKPLLLLVAAAGESINDDVVLADVEREHAPSVSIARLPGGHNLHRNEFERFAEIFESWLIR